MYDTVRRVGTAYLFLSFWFVVTVAASLAVFALASGPSLPDAGPVSMSFGFGVVGLGMIAGTIATGLAWQILRVRGHRSEGPEPIDAPAQDSERRKASLLPSR